MRPSKLLRQTLFGLLLLLVAVVLATSVISGWNLNRLLREQYESKGIAIANSIASSSVEIILNRDPSTLQSIVDQYAEIEGVSYVFVVDDADEVVAHTFVPRVPQAVYRASGGARQTVARDLNLEGIGDVTDVSAPILAGHAGYVHVGMNRGLIADRIWSAIGSTSLTLLIVMGVLVSIVAAATIRGFTSRINSYVDFVLRIARGDLAARAQVSGDDELTLLGHSLNEMATVRQELFEQLQTLNVELEQRVAERTVQLEDAVKDLEEQVLERRRAEAAAQAASVAAEEANRAKSAFLATMSHEIRTPMNAIIGMAGLLLDTPLNAQQRDFVETVRNSGDALLTIINDILDFSKIESGRLELDIHPVDLRDLVESALDLLATKTHEKGLELACLVEAHTPSTVLTDSTRVRQILLNFLSNALKFTEKGEVVLSLSGRELAEASQPSEADDERWFELHFSVRDTGIGIPVDRMDRLFKSFSQADASTSRRYGGTGLGLVISQRLAEMMNGTAWVESEVGKGSVFHFTIQAQATADSRPIYLRGEQPQLSGKRMLVVDDNATNRKILTLQAESWGVVPVVTASGPEALEIVQRGEPLDLAILDMQMPDMDGLTLAEEIRRLRDAQSLPLVMLSSLGVKGADPRKAYFSAFLTKPIKASALYDALVDVVARTPDQAARRERPAAELGIDPHLGERLPLRILLADDHAINQKVALRMLERMGYRADVAGNGLEVLSSLERQPYDVVLMDVRMPEMDGLEAAGRIRDTWTEAERPRIVALTADAMQGDREMCLAAGMDDYLSKPIQPPALQAVLERWGQWVREHARGTAETSATPPGIAVAEEVGVSGDQAAAVVDQEPASAPPSETVATAEPAELPPDLDPSVLDGFREMDPEAGADLVREVLELFWGEAPPLVDAVRAAVAQGDAERLRRAAHALKGICGNIGAKAMAAASQELEMMGRSGTVEGAPAVLRRLEQGLERLRPAADAYLAEPVLR